MAGKKRGPKPKKSAEIKVQVPICVKRKHVKVFKVKALELAAELNEK